MSKNWTDKYHKQANGESAPDQEFERFQELTEFDCPVNVDKAWARVRAHTQSASSTWSNLLKIAAVVFVTIGLGWVAFENYSKTDLVDQIAQQQTEVLLLADGSEVTLAPSAQLSYPKSFGETREVTLQGEAYFKVAKGTEPFIIHTGLGDVQVLGTQFSVNANDVLDVMVTSGSVSVKSGEKQVALMAGERARSNGSEIRKLEQFDPNLVSWKTGHFKFDNETLKQAIPHLERYYNVTINTSKSLQNCKVTAEFKEASLDEVVATLQSILQVKAKKKGDQIKLIGRGCN